MTALTNPEISIRVLGSSEITLADVHKSIEIIKDLDEEPNEADIEIYNLSPDTRAALTTAAGEYAPIEISIAGFGAGELVLAFAGEIDSITHLALRPGHETRIHCTSQLRTHRAAYIDGVTYAAGTPYSTIVSDFVDKIGIPLTGLTVPDTGILSSQTYTGPAYPLLCRVVGDIGYFCYILDGEIQVSGVAETATPDSIEITPAMMLSAPQAITRTDARTTQLAVMSEGGSSDPFARKTVKKQELRTTTYEEIEVIDVVVPGIEVECFCIPTLQPDNIVSIAGVAYRVFAVTHYGDNFGSIPPTTRIQADAYDGGSAGGVVL